MTDTGIFIFGMFVFGVAIGASLIATIGGSDATSIPPENNETIGTPVAVSAPRPHLD